MDGVTLSESRPTPRDGSNHQWSKFIVGGATPTLPTTCVIGQLVSLPPIVTRRRAKVINERVIVFLPVYRESGGRRERFLVNFVVAILARRMIPFVDHQSAAECPICVILLFCLCCYFVC